MTVDGAFQAVLPDYEITAELGGGATGIVYLGRHRALERIVAIKRLPPSFAADPHVRERFVAGARVLVALDHPHIVVVHDFVDRGTHLAIVMEHLPNGTVWDQFVHHGLGGPKACGLVLATLSGLQYAHERGAVHREIKPENLIFGADGQLKVTDIGMAQVMTGPETMGTAQGAIVGNPAYMSPEQVDGRTCGPPADIYATGAMLYELLSGSLPFPDSTAAIRMAMARLTHDPAPLISVAPFVPPEVSDVAMRALSRAEDDRFESAESFGVALAEAAVEAWGTGWMSEAGVVLAGNEPIEQASYAGRSIGGAAPTRSTALLVQPQQLRRVVGADLHQLSPADIVNLAEVRVPKSPLPALAVAVVLLIISLAISLIGWGSDPLSQNAGQVTIGGELVEAGTDPLEVDFTQVVATNASPVDGLDATFLGIPIGSAEVSEGVLDPGYLRWTAAGVVELSGRIDDSDVTFPLRSSNSVYQTVPFVAAVLMALAGLLSIQANLHGLRGRRVRIGAFVGLAVGGAISGAMVAILGMLLLEAPAERRTVAAAAVVAGLGSLALGQAYRRWHRRRRLRRVLAAADRRT